MNLIIIIKISAILILKKLLLTNIFILVVGMEVSVQVVKYNGMVMKIEKVSFVKL